MTAEAIAKLRDTIRMGVPSSDFDLTSQALRPKDRILRPAAVLIPLIVLHDRIQVILTKRTSHLKHHPGQIAFPGGKKDEADADATATALREAHEEIGLPQTCVNVLGELSPHETVTGFQVTPIVGFIHRPFEITPQEDEVQEVFHVPLSHLFERGNYHIQSRLWQGQLRSYYTVPYGPYYIWGATARILRAWSETQQ